MLLTAPSIIKLVSVEVGLESMLITPTSAVFWTATRVRVAPLICMAVVTVPAIWTSVSIAFSLTCAACELSAEGQ